MDRKKWVMKRNMHTYHGGSTRVFNPHPVQAGSFMWGNTSGSCIKEIFPTFWRRRHNCIRPLFSWKDEGAKYLGFNSAILGHVISFLHQFSLQLTSKVEAVFFFFVWKLSKQKTRSSHSLVYWATDLVQDRKWSCGRTMALISSSLR